MPTNKSAIKRLRTGEKARIRHKAKKSELKTLEKKFRAAIDSGEMETAQTLLTSLNSKFDKAAQSHTIPRNRANRKKSQLNQKVVAS